MSWAIRLSLPKTDDLYTGLAKLQQYMVPPTRVYGGYIVVWNIEGKASRPEVWMLGRRIGELIGAEPLLYSPCGEPIMRTRSYTTEELSLSLSFPVDLAMLLRNKHTLWLSNDDNTAMYAENYGRLRDCGLSSQFATELLGYTSLVGKHYPWDFIEDNLKGIVWLRGCPPGLRLRPTDDGFKVDAEEANKLYGGVVSNTRAHGMYYVKCGTGAGAYTRPK